MLKKITESDINGLGVVGLADTPGLSATDMQEKFEEISKSAIIPKFNQLIDDLEALNIYQKVDSVEGKGLSTNDYTNEDKEALYSTKGKIDETVKIFGKASIDFGRKSDSVIGDKSTALGADNTASGNYSDAFGNGNVSSGLASHSEGANNISSGKYSHAEGNRNEATKDYSHAEGYETKATSLASHSEGQTTNASGTCSHAEGYLTKAFDFSHSEGDSTTASGIGSHAEGSETEASGLNSHSEGKLSVASGKYSHAEGNTTKAIADNSHAEGAFTKVDSSGENGHAEGYGSIVTGSCSHAEGINSKSEGSYSHAEGNNTTAKGSCSHSEGAGTIAQGENSHAEGSNTTSSGSSSHAEGTSSQASGAYSHAEGAGTVASGDYSHAEGSGTKAKGSNAHAEGGATIATGEFQHVQGKFNEEDADGIYAHIVGGGTSDTDRKNIHTIDWQGNAEFAGNVTDGYGNSMSLLKTESGHSLELSIDENYIMTISLLNKSGETISSKAIDFPVERMVVNASYSSGKLTLILQNGNTVDVDVSAIVKGLVNESRTIAGIDLKDDITADELITALGVDVIKNDVEQLKSGLDDIYIIVCDKFYDLDKSNVQFIGTTNIALSDISIIGNSIKVTKSSATFGGAFYIHNYYLFIPNRKYLIYYDVVANNDYYVRVRTLNEKKTWGGFVNEFTQSGNAHITHSAIYEPTVHESLALDLKDNNINNYSIIIKVVDITDINENDVGVINFDKLENGETYFFLKDNNSLQFYSRWKNKEVSFLGDSLTADGRYIAYIKDMCGLSVANNYGVGGTTLADNGQGNSFCDRYTQISDTSDLICVMGGTNDYSQQIPIGTNESTDKTTFKGAVRYLIEKLEITFPRKEIVFITPPYRDAPSGKEGTVRDYVNAMKEICSYIGIKCISPYENIGINEYNLSLYSADGTHYYKEGYEKLAIFIAENI